MAEPTRKRAKNFHLKEIDILTEMVISNLNTLNAKHCNGASAVTKKSQNAIWEQICKEINSVGITTRTVAEIKEKWRNLTKAAKSEVSRQRVSATKTGGGPPELLTDPVLEDIANVFADSASFYGIRGAFKSETAIMPLDSQSEVNLELVTEDNALHCNDVNHWDTIFNPVITQDHMVPIIHASGINNSKTKQLTPTPSIEHPTNKETPVINTVESPALQKTTNREPPLKRTQQSLKEIQTEFYKQALKNEQDRNILIKEQLATVQKFSLCLDIFFGLI